MPNKNDDLGLIGEAGTAGHSDLRSADVEAQEIHELSKEAVQDKGPERPMPPNDPEER